MTDEFRWATDPAITIERPGPDDEIALEHVRVEAGDAVPDELAVHDPTRENHREWIVAYEPSFVDLDDAR